ncbi:MAG: hypothetical protein ACM3PP_07655 [Candidatus Saccharibacteria bacterium]
MKLREALGILMSNIIFFLAVTLIIWVPAYSVIIIKNLFYTGVSWPAVTEFYGALLPWLDFNKVLSEFISFCIDATVISLLVPFHGGVTVYAAYKLKQGQQLSLGEALVEGYKKWWTMLCVSFLYSVFVFLGCLLFIIPGIIVAAIFSLVFVNAVVEEPNIWRNFERSMELTRPQLLQVIGATFVVLVVLGLVSSVLDGSVYWMGAGKNQLVVLFTGLMGQILSLIYWVYPLPFYAGNTIKDAESPAV